MRRRVIITLAAALAAACLLLLAGCQSGLNGVKPRTPLWRPAKVAVLPFSKVLAEPGQGSTVCSPLTGSAFVCGTGGAPGAKAEQALTDALMTYLYDRASFAVVPPSQTDVIYRRLQMERMGVPMVKVVTELGRKVDAQGVLVGLVYRFRDRQGSAYSVDRPASVAFDVAMVRVSDGAVLWKNSFDQTQKPLSSDLFNLPQYLRHGIKWYSAEQYARIGLSQLMESFPWQVAPASLEQ